MRTAGGTDAKPGTLHKEASSDIAHQKTATFVEYA